MTITAEQIAGLYAQRRLAAGPDQARMQEVQRMYDGSVVVPLPELNKNEKNFIPNRVQHGLTQIAQRVASQVPNPIWPAVRPGIEVSQKRANDRRKANLGWWEYNRMALVLRQRARYLLAYASAPVEICWHDQLEIPKWDQQNPLFTYPAFMRNPQDLCPRDCIYETTQTLGWIMDRYPMQAAILSKPGTIRDTNGNLKRDARFVLLRYIDEAECVLVVLGQRDEYTTPTAGSIAVELERYDNRAETCGVVYPRQISLSSLHGMFDGMEGMYQTEAKLSALGVIATEKGVFGDYWLISNQNETARVIQPPEKDGTPGIVSGGTLQRIGVDPQFQTNATIDRLAEAQLLQSGLSSELSGVAPTNVRTGVRAQNLLANAIDFPIQEAQELFQESLQEENRKAVKFAKAYTTTSVSFYVSAVGEEVTYNPSEVFETDRNIVRYPLVGADQAGLVISGEQRVQAGTLSKREFMEIDPMVKDPEFTHDKIIEERLEQVVLAALEQQVASGQLETVFAAQIAQAVVSNKSELFEAVSAAHKAAQEQQAQQAAASAPEAQPGLAGPAQAMQGPQQPPDLASVLASLRRPQTGVTPQEQMAG